MVHRRRPRSPAARVRHTYARLLFWGALAGLGRRAAETPLEYAARLRGVQAAWAAPAPAGAQRAPATGPRGLARRLAVPLAGEAEGIAGAYVRSRYGREAVTEARAREVHAHWVRLRSQLPLLALGPPP